MPLFAGRILPLADPAFLQTPPLRKPIDRLKAPVIHGTVSAVQWTDWLVRHGVAQGPGGLALHFDRAQFVLDAALQGLGVALESATIRWAIRTLQWPESDSGAGTVQLRSSSSNNE